MPSSGFFELVAYTDLAAADVFAAVDVSDPTQSPQGSLKKITAASVFAAAQPITIASGTVTLSTPVFQATQTWNAGAVTFTAIDLNVTSTASAAASLLMNLRVASTSMWKVDKSGNETVAGLATINGGAAITGNSSVTGTLAVTSTLQAGSAGGNVQMQLGPGAPAADNSGALEFRNTNVSHNWQIGNNSLTGDALTITPSTAGGGSTYTTPVVTVKTTGVTFAGDVLFSGGIRNNRATTSCLTGTFTTAFNLPAVDGAYLVITDITGSGAAYQSTSIVNCDGISVYTLTKLVTGVSTDVQMSGGNFQVKQNSGGTANVQTVAIRIA